jgi:hypothetical protein
VKNFLLPVLSFSIFSESFGPSPAGSFVTIILAPPPYENDLFDSADAIRTACVGFAKSEGYVVNQRDLDIKRLTAVEMCAQNYYKARRRWHRAASKYNK